MIEIVLSILLVVAFSYYLWFLWIVRRGLKFSVTPDSEIAPTVSVVVAARNEEQNIKSCLQALANQDYDNGRYEIIIVDDHSADRTNAIAAEYAEKSTRAQIKVIALGAQAPERGKPAAIARGIEASTGEIILCTDADCKVPTSWVRSMAGCFGPSVAFVAGPVAERSGENLLMGLQSLEFLGLLTSAAGLIGSGTPIICNGANIAYRKSAFQKAQGYDQMKSSCDDETLMQRMIARQVGRVVFNADALAVVTTDTPSSVSEFLSQRMRWAAKRGRYDDPRLLLRLIALYAFFLLLLLAAFASAVLPTLRPFVLTVFVLKAVAEFMVLRSGARLFQAQFPLSHFLIAEVFHVPYIVIAASVGQIMSMQWKGRILDR